MAAILWRGTFAAPHVYHQSVIRASCLLACVSFTTLFVVVMRVCPPRCVTSPRLSLARPCLCIHLFLICLCVCAADGRLWCLGSIMFVLVIVVKCLGSIFQFIACFSLCLSARRFNLSLRVCFFFWGVGNVCDASLPLFMLVIVVRWFCCVFHDVL